VLYKNDNGYKVLKSIDFAWGHGQEYSLKIKVKDAQIGIFKEEEELFSFIDEDNPYLKGQVGFSVREGSRCSYRGFKIGRF